VGVALDTDASVLVLLRRDGTLVQSQSFTQAVAGPSCAEGLIAWQRLWDWCWAPTETTRMLNYLDSASAYDAWSAAAFALDRHLNYDIW